MGDNVPAICHVYSGWRPLRGWPRGVTLALACLSLPLCALPAHAGSYTAGNETQLRNAINAANADGDPTATITLTANVVISNPAAFPAFVKPTTLDTGAFTLSGADIASGTAPGTTLTFSGGSLITAGTIRGGHAATRPSGNAAAGGIAINFGSGGSLSNLATVTGGKGGSTTGTNVAGGSGGVGVLAGSSAVLNQGIITGGAGGNVDVNFAGGSSSNTFAGAGGAGLILSGGSLDNQASIAGGVGGSIIDLGSDNQFAGAGGTGALLIGATHVNAGTIAGAKGGIGVNTGASGHGAGGGGLALSGGASLVNDGTILGADGRAGGGTGGGSGSAGGFGVMVTGSTLHNTGTIQAGHAGGTAADTAGVGVLGADAAVINRGAISAGRLALGAGPFGNAVQFTAGVNRLELHAGSIILGTVLANGTADTFALGGAASSPFNVALIGPAAQYRGFEAYQMTGTGTWTLTGTTTAPTPWQLLSGTLSVSSNANLGGIAGALTFNGGTLQVTGTTFTSTARAINWGAKGGGFDIADASNTFIVAQSLSGAGPLTMLGAGTLALTGSNTYAGGTTISSGTLQIGNGGLTGAITGDVLNNGTLAFDRLDPLTFDGAITGSGSVEQIGGGTTVLTGASTYAGPTSVASGTLLIDGDQSSATGPTSVANGATLGGTGTIGGSGAIANGGILAPGAAGDLPGTLAIAGDLALSNSSVLNYNFGQANVVGGAFNDLTQVGGTVILDGTFDVTVSPGGSFMPGVYRIISYQGALTDNTLELGAMPGGTGPFYVQTSIANQVNLVNTTGLTLNYWDGAAGPKNDGQVNGGDGTWNIALGNDSWTTQDGTINAPFSNGDFAIFAGTPGAVVVDNGPGQVMVSGLQFLTGGYRIEGGALQLVGPSATIRVGDGTPDGAAYVATIASQLTGTAQLVVADLGTLVLTAANSYTGGTKIAQGGVLQVSQDAALGALGGGLTFDDGTLRTTASLQTDRTVALDGQGSFLPDAGTTLTVAGTISGAGSLIMGGSGELVLTAAATHTGDTIVAAGTLRAGAAHVLSGASAHEVLAGATLNLNGFDQAIASLSNAGTVVLNGKPGTILTVTGYTGAGGLLKLNTVLGNDASATDRLVVSGAISGTSNIEVTNIGGTGAPTVDGIKIVDVAGASNGAFVLQGDYVFRGEQAVVGGAFAYTLQKNGVTTPADGDWYLRSTLINPPPLVPPGPLFQPGVPLYEACPQILLGLMGLPTLRERRGHDAVAGRVTAAVPVAYIDDGGSYLGGPPVAGDERASADRDTVSAWWGRVDASRIGVVPSLSTAGATYHTDQVRLQTGFDALIHADRAGKLMAGLTVQHGSASARVDSVWGDGKISTEAYGIGGTLTWLGLDGVYVDTQAQVNWFNTDLRSSLVGAMADGDHAAGYGVSVETGKRLVSHGAWALTPQAQVSYTSVDFAFTDPFDAVVSARSGASLLGRVGVALDYREAWLTGSFPARSHMYTIANLYYEFLDGTSVDVSGTRIVSRKDELWGALGVGGTYTWGADKYALFSEVSVNTSLENFAESYSINATAGLRIRW